MVLDDPDLLAAEPPSVAARIQTNQQELDKILGMIKNISDGLGAEDLRPVASE